MKIPSVIPNSEAPTPWIMRGGQAEMPPGPPMPLENPWVKSLQLLFSKENPEHLRKYAMPLLMNMTRMFASATSRNERKARETAQRWKDAIAGR